MFNYSIGSSQICQPCFVCSSHYQLSSGWQLRRRCAWASLRISAQNWGEREKKLQVDILMLFSLCNCTASHSSEKFKSAFFPSFFTVSSIWKCSILNSYCGIFWPVNKCFLGCVWSVFAVHFVFWNQTFGIPKKIF